MHYRILPHKGYRLGDYALETIQPGDIESVRLWRNEQMVYLRQSNSISPEEQVAYFENHIWPQLDMDEPSQILFRFTHCGALIGYGGLVHLHLGYKRSEQSFLNETGRSDPDTFARDFRHFFKILNHIAFVELGLNKLHGERYNMEGGNRNAVGLLMDELGYQREGVLRDWVIIDGGFVDATIHGLLKNEFTTFTAQEDYVPISAYD